MPAFPTGVLGFLPALPTTAGTVQNNAAANWFAHSFVADGSRTINTARTYISAVAGTLGGSDITCDLYDSTGLAGVPGSSIETGKVPTATINAAGYYDWTGFTTALTAGTEYWLVFKNVNGTPASNNCTFAQISTYAQTQTMGSSINRNAWQIGSSTNTGSTWATSGRTCLRVGYADGTFAGLVGNTPAATAVGNGVYATRECGIKFTSPANGILNFGGLGMFLSTQTGTPTNGFRFGLWTGSTPSLLAYTQTVPRLANSTSQWIDAYFASTQTVQPGTICRLTLATSGADASGNRYNLLEMLWDTQANSLPLLPWNGTATKTYYDGSSWTDSTLGTSIFGHAALLAPGGEFGGSSGAIVKVIQNIGTY